MSRTKKMSRMTKLIFFFGLIICKSLVSQDATLIYKGTANSTVTIETDLSLGSGFFVAPNIIATNYHVIEGATHAFCYLNNSEVKYKIDGYLAADKSVDLILLKVSTLTKPA
jgi:S1-C subfamily serine protease